MTAIADLKAKALAATARAAAAAERLHAATLLLQRGNVTPAERAEMQAAAKEDQAAGRASRKAIAALMKAAGEA